MESIVLDPDPVESISFEPDLDPDPLQETLIWIRVANKNSDKLAYKSTKIIRINFKKEITYFV